MRLFYLLVVYALMIAGCQRPSVDDPTPVTPPQVPEPPLVDIQYKNDSLYIDSQLIYTRTTTTDVRFSCRFGITNPAFARKRIREYGFCLSATDSVLSIKNPQQLRLKATFDSVNYQFEAITQDLIPAKDYYIEPYFIMQDGRVYYGRYLATPRLQTPSWVPRPSMNAITRFRINQVEKSIYSPITLVNRTTVPITTLNYDFYSFICNENLYVLDRNGNLFQYDASKNKWLPRQQLTIEPSGSFNGWPALVFGVNNKGYVLYSDALVPNPTFHWEYNPNVDQWTKLDTPNKPVLAPYNYTYETGNQVFLADTYQKRMVRFDALQKAVQTVALPNLTNYLITNQPLLTISGNAYAYFGNYDENGNGKLYSARYDLATDTFGQSSLISDKQSDLSPALVGSVGNDLLVGLGNTLKFIPTSRIYTQIVTTNDDLIRYSTDANQLTARYDLSAIRSGNSNTVNWVNYKSFTLNGRVYVIDRSTSKLWELTF